MDIEDYNSLVLAVKANKYDLSKELIRIGAKQGSDVDGNVPLYHAIKNLNGEMIELLLCNDPNILPNNKGYTVYTLMADMGSIELMNYIYDRVDAVVPLYDKIYIHKLGLETENTKLLKWIKEHT